MSDLLVNKIDMDILRCYIMVVISGLGSLRYRCGEPALLIADIRC